MKAALPVNEQERIARLQYLQILDSPAEASFDDVVQLARLHFNVPIALISLVDTNRQWFKACFGLSARETHRDLAFCAHAILQPSAVMVVEDTLEDERFFDNALVTSAPYIRFYAGAPLVLSDGCALGTLCIIDTQPRSFTDEQREFLRLLAGQVISLIELHEKNIFIHTQSAQTKRLLDTAPLLIGQLDNNLRYVFANKKYAEWFDVDPESTLGRFASDVHSDELKEPMASGYLRCLAGEKFNFELNVKDNLVLSVTYVPIFHSENNSEVIGLFIIAADITVQLLHRQELERERSYLSSVIKGANIGTWQWNVANGGLVLNERWTEMLGYNLEELQPISLETWSSLVHPQDLEDASKLLQQNFSGELNYYDAKLRMKHKNGRWMWIHTRGQIITYAETGEPLMMYGTHTDIDELQQVHEKLREKEGRLQSMLGNFPGAVYRCENNSRWSMHFLSDNVQTLTGYPAAEFLLNGGRSFSDITHADDIPMLFEQVQEALGQRRSFDLFYRIQRADGDWRWVEEIGTGVYDEEGNLIFIDGFIWDVTESEEARYKIRLSEQKLASLYNMSPVAIALNRFSDGEYLECNPEFFSMLGYTPEEFKSKTYWDVTPIEYDSDEKKQIDILQLTGRYGPYEKHYIHKNGDKIPVLLNGVLIDSADGEKQIWSIIQDITERKRIEQMKNDFVSAVSHELRTPLTSISGSLALSVNGMLGELPPKVNQVLAIAHKNCQRLSLLINDLLDMEKLLAGKMFFDIHPQLLLPLIEQVLAENRVYADTCAVTLHLKNCSADLTIEVDSQRFLQVLTNLISNAVKFSHEGGAVEVDVIVDAERVRLSVLDTGLGIAPEFHQRIFQKFSQADSSDARQRGGTGLGLAISKELVERMNGTVGFESELGKGSLFYVEFSQLKATLD
jgi:PAS domain S-box-containing protein